MSKWKFKSCPRCHGDIFIDSDFNGWYEQCLQCSYRQELKSLPEFKRQLAREKKERASVS